MDMNKKLLSLLAILLTGVLFTPAFATWRTQTLPIPNTSTYPALNVGADHQRKTGDLTVNNLRVNQGGMFTRVVVGSVGTISNGLNASGKVTASRFCLGSTPSPDGCISNWQGGLNLSGGRANSLLRWINPATPTYSAISETGKNIAMGDSASPRAAGINGNLNLESGTRLQTGLKISQLAGNLTATQIAALPKSNRILSVDATGKIVLTNADCGVAVTAPPVTVPPTTVVPTTPANDTRPFTFTQVTLGGKAFPDIIRPGDYLPLSWVATGAEYFTLRATCPSGAGIYYGRSNICGVTTRLNDKNLRSINLSFIFPQSGPPIYGEIRLDAIDLDRSSTYLTGTISHGLNLRLWP